LPLLRHRHMLEITKQAKRLTVQPGEIILDLGKPVENLYIISSGTVNVEKKNGKAREVISHLKTGEFFGEIELLRGGKAIADVRAGHQPVELLAFPREDFLRIVEESPITAEALGRIVQDRLKEHSVSVKVKSTKVEKEKKKVESGKSRTQKTKGELKNVKIKTPGAKSKAKNIKPIKKTTRSKTVKRKA